MNVLERSVAFIWLQEPGRRHFTNQRHWRQLQIHQMDADEHRFVKNLLRGGATLNAVQPIQRTKVSSTYAHNSMPSYYWGRWYRRSLGPTTPSLFALWPYRRRLLGKPGRVPQKCRNAYAFISYCHLSLPQILVSPNIFDKSTPMTLIVPVKPG